MSIELIVFLVLLVLGYGFGRAAEQRHYRSIYQRERGLLLLPAVTLKTLPDAVIPERVALVCGSVVISVDYFKRFVAGLRNLIGGRLTAYETLLDRARREAILRMKEQAIAEGASSIYNVRLETTAITKNNGKRQSTAAVEVVAYGSAIIVSSRPAP